MIREADYQDVTPIWHLAKEAHALTPYAGIPMDEAKCRQIIAMAMASPAHFCWVAEVEGEVAGVLVGMVDEPYWTRKKQASDLLFYTRETAKGEGAKLALRFAAWCRERHAIKLWGFAISSGVEVERTERMYGHMGLQRVGGIFLEVKA